MSPRRVYFLFFILCCLGFLSAFFPAEILRVVAATALPTWVSLEVVQGFSSVRLATQAASEILAPLWSAISEAPELVASITLLSVIGLVVWLSGDETA